MNTNDIIRFEAAHVKCIRHRSELEKSKTCGCFYCVEVFRPAEIVRRTDNGQMALCPKCEIDSVIGDADVPEAGDKDFLERMHAYWFERTTTGWTVH